jgi:CRISPR-associated endoribonuclease Cas6
MLLSLIFKLKPEQNGSLPFVNAHHLHGIFFNKILEDFDPKIAQQIHLAAQKPFTLSNLQPFIPQNEAIRWGKFNLNPDQRYWFRLTSLEEWFSRFLLDNLKTALARQTPLRIDNINGLVFRVEEIFEQQDQHPWASTITFQGLTKVGQQLALKAMPPEGGTKVRLHFYSPTTIQVANPEIPNAVLLVPWPRSIFSNLAERWTTFSRLPLRTDFTEFLEEKVTISAYSLQTELIHLKKPLKCFRGWCEYTSYSKERPLNELLHTLSLFAFYAGTGSKTTMGCGQTSPFKTN